MGEFDRIKHIKKLQQEGFSVPRKQSSVLNNFYALITIGVVCISILFYTNYVVPAQEAKKNRELKAQKEREYFEKRAKQIALSHKLNNTKDNMTDE